MEKFFLDHFQLCIVILVAGTILSLGIIYRKHWLPKKTICEKSGCNKKATDTDNNIPLCEDHYYEALYERALVENLLIRCPIDGTQMELKLVVNAGNVPIHVCPHCGHTFLSKKSLKEMTVMPLEIYPKK
jgi:hypothetical protein